MAEHELLSQETTRELIARFQAGDNEAAETLVQANTALVRSIVKRFLNRSIEYEDLFQIGCMGLVKAISRFDLSYDVRFSTYAVPMIAGEIKRFLRDDGMIKVSRSLKELAARAASAREKLSDKLGREASINEIAKELSEIREIILEYCLEGEPVRAYIGAIQRMMNTLFEHCKLFYDEGIFGAAFSKYCGDIDESEAV